jgi:hypothetical protein
MMSRSLHAILVCTLLLGGASAAELKEETATVKLKVSDEQVLAAIKANDVAAIEQLIAAGWNPGQPLKRGERRNSVGLVEPDLTYPLAEALATRSFDVARLLAAHSTVETMELVSSGSPAWIGTKYFFSNHHWSAARAEQSAVAGEILRIFLRSKTSRVSGDDHLILDAYTMWPIRATDRLPLYTDGLLRASDLDGATGRAVLTEALRQFRLNAAVSESAALNEIKTIVGFGVSASAVGDDALKHDGIFEKSCLSFDTNQYPGTYCSSGENFGRLDRRAAQALIDAGWKPRQAAIDAFWDDAWSRPKGPEDAYSSMGACAFHTDHDLLVIAYTRLGAGFSAPAGLASATSERELLSIPQLRPGQRVIAKLQSAVDRYQRKFVGMDRCYYGYSSQTCRPAPETLCGATLLAVGGHIK